MYSGETSRTLDTRLRECMYNFKKGHLAMSKKQWMKGGILKFKPHPTYRKYKPTAHMLHVEISLFGSAW